MTKKLPDNKAKVKWGEFTTKKGERIRYSWLNKKGDLYSPSKILKGIMATKFGCDTPEHIKNKFLVRGGQIGTALEELHLTGKYDKSIEWPVAMETLVKYLKKNKLTIYDTEYYALNLDNMTHGRVDLIVSNEKGHLMGIEIKSRNALKIDKTDMIQAAVYRTATKIPFEVWVINNEGDIMVRRLDESWNVYVDALIKNHKNIIKLLDAIL